MSTQDIEGFTCHEAGEVTLEANSTHSLFFKCDDSEHHIIGQADNGEHCVGIYHVG